MSHEASESFLSPAVRVVKDVGGGRGRGVIASRFIKAGELLISQRQPLAFASRATPDCVCAYIQGGRGGGAPGPIVTCCDSCLRPYDHHHKVYRGVPGRESAAAKCCSACRVVYYCSSNCQREAWARHKSECHIFHRKCLYT